jgi:hypothetical protein
MILDVGIQFIKQSTHVFRAIFRMRTGIEGIDHAHQRLVLFVNLVYAQRKVAAPLDYMQFDFLPPLPDPHTDSGLLF